MGVKVAILGSTRGTAMQGILDALAARTLNAEIVLVASDKADAPILDRARQHGLPTAFFDPAGLPRDEFDARISESLLASGAQLVLLIGYMRILSDGFVEQWRGRLLNVHPSLLPAFGAMTDVNVHAAVLAAGVAETGCTIHQVTEIVDGGPIVLQKRCPVLPGDTVETLKERVQMLEQQGFVEVLQGWST